MTTLAGMPGRTSSVDGTGADARFEDPFATAVDLSGNIYVADSAAHIVRKIGPEGVVTTFAGSPGSFGSANGLGTAARFYSPFGVAVDSAGSVYVADSRNNTVRKISPEGVVTTLAGTALQRGSTDGAGETARFDQPYGIADASGNLFVTDTDNQAVRQVTPAGVVTTVGGGTIGSADGVGTAAQFFNPKGIAADRDGRLYIADRGNHTIRHGARLNASSH